RAGRARDSSRASSCASGLAFWCGRAVWTAGSVAVERCSEDIVNGVHEDEFLCVARLRWQLVEIALVLAGEDEPLQAGTLRGEGFLADAADRQNLSGQRDLAGHPDLLRHGLSANERRERRRHRDTCEWSVLRHGAGRYLDVHVVGREPIIRK